MIRLFVKGIYMNPGGECEHDIKTFEIQCPNLESYLTENIGYAGCGTREVIGHEIVKISMEAGIAEEEEDEQTKRPDK